MDLEGGFFGLEGALLHTVVCQKVKGPWPL